jgi:hypothetical protein
MWVILEFLKSSTHEWAAASAFHAMSQPTFLSPQVYLRGNPFLFIVTLHLLFRHCYYVFFLAPLQRSIATSSPLRMRVKRLSQQTPMVKLSHEKQAASWTVSKITDVDRKKIKKEGFLAQSAEIIFPGSEVILRPQDGFRVMFLSFLVCGLSLPAHKFLCGLLFVYGVQLHQLTPNSILHIAYFITLCKAFLVLTLIGDYGSTSSICAAMCPRKKFMSLGAPLFLCDHNLST